MIYKYLFYKLYINIDKVEKGWGEAAITEHSASSTITLLLTINLMSLLIFIDNLFDLDGKLFKPSIIFTFLVVLDILNYLYFIRKKKYLKIIDEWKNETKKQSILRGVIVLAYVIISLTVFMIIGTIEYYKNS